MKTFSDLRINLAEKTLTPAEMKKREEVAKAIERDNPDMPMAKKMAIATATAKKVAEEQEGVAEGDQGALWRVEKSEGTGKFYAVKGYNKARKVWKNKFGAGDHNSEEEAKARVGKLNQGVAEETIHVGYRNSKGVWIKTSTHSNYPAAEKAMDDLEKQGKKGVQHRYDNKGNIDPGTHNFRKVDEQTEEKDSLNEMDKSAPQPGRDGKVTHSTYGSRDKKGSDYFKGKEAPGKAITVKQMGKDALDILKKQGVAEAIIKQPPKKMDIPAAIRKAQGGNWKTTTQDIEKDKLRNMSSAEALAAGRKKEGLSEVNDYFKRRAKEEGIIAGTKAPRKTPKKSEPMSDYSKRRAKEAC